MAFYTTESIREKLSVMERGKGIAYFKHVYVTFNPQGEFNVFNATQHCKYSTTTSLTEAVKHVKIALN